ncbi:Pseudouridine-5'-phosphatase [Homalodisca vitripennis]|nr:Pseudouridine-5'-phosphatase [Homalodisca vitripennis]
MGTKEQDTVRILVEELKLPVDVEEFNKEYMNCIVPTLSDVELKPGAEKLVHHFHKNGVPLAMATSSGIESCEIKLKRFSELKSCFHHIVMGSSDKEVVNGKPAPDIFFLAAKRFPDNPSPNKCLVFEDSYNGVLAARAAGMQVVMVPEALVSEEKRKKATIVSLIGDDCARRKYSASPFGEVSSECNHSLVTFTANISDRRRQYPKKVRRISIWRLKQ